MPSSPDSPPVFPFPKVAADIFRAHATEWKSVFALTQLEELFKDTVIESGLDAGLELLKLHQLYRLTDVVYYLADKVEHIG